MLNRLTHVVLAIGTLILIGCAGTKEWVHAYGSERFEAASYICERDAQAWEDNEDAKLRDKASTRCSGYNLDGTVSVNCSKSTPSGGSPLGAFLMGLTKGLARNKVFERCMNAHGWEEREVAPSQVSAVSSYKGGVSSQPEAVYTQPGSQRFGDKKDCRTDSVEDRNRWHRATVENTREDYHAYLTDCNPGLYEKSAKLAIAKLALTDAHAERSEVPEKDTSTSSIPLGNKKDCSIDDAEDKKRWRRATVENTREAYHVYLTDCNPGMYEESAKLAIAKLALTDVHAERSEVPEKYTSTSSTPPSASPPAYRVSFVLVHHCKDCEGVQSPFWELFLDGEMLSRTAVLDNHKEPVVLYEGVITGGQHTLHLETYTSITGRRDQRHYETKYDQTLELLDNSTVLIVDQSKIGWLSERHNILVTVQIR